MKIVVMMMMLLMLLLMMTLNKDEGRKQPKPESILNASA